MLQLPFPCLTPGFRRIPTLVSAIATILLCNLGVAFSSDENDLLDSSGSSPEIGRATGLAHIDLRQKTDRNRLGRRGAGSPRSIFSISTTDRRGDTPIRALTSDTFSSLLARKLSSRVP